MNIFSLLIFFSSATASTCSAENAPQIELSSPLTCETDLCHLCGDGSEISGTFSVEEVSASAKHLSVFSSETVPLVSETDPAHNGGDGSGIFGTFSVEKISASAEPTDKDIIAALMKKAGEMKEFSAKFRQVRKVALLTDEVVSTGEMQYRNDGRIMWRYTSPKKQQIAFSAKDIRITEGTQTRILALDDNPYLGQLKDLLMGLMSGKQLDADGRFAVKAVKNDAKLITLSMTPVQRQLKKFISEVTITFTAPDSTVSEVVMKEPDGSSTTITFTDRKVL